MKFQPFFFAAALVTPSAFSRADVVIYGIAQGSIDMGNTGNGAGTRVSYQDIGSRVGFRSKDKLDYGGELQWQLEQNAYSGDGRDSNWGSREAWVGIVDPSTGSLRAGKSKSTYDLIVEEFDLFESNTTLANTFQAGTYKTRYNGVFYASPNLAGLVLKADYNTPESFRNSGDFSYQTSGWGASAKYSAPHFALFSSWQTLQNNGGRILPNRHAGADSCSWMLGAQWFPVPSGIVGALYQHTRQDAAALSDKGEMKRDTALLMAQVSMGPWTPRVGYVHHFKGRFADGTELAVADHFEIGTDYNLTKHSLLYAEASYINNHGQNLFTSSLGGEGWRVGAPGNSNVLSVGLIELF